MSRKKMFFVVELVPPPGATEADVKAYILREVQSGKGSRHPGDPIFSLDSNSIVVRKAKL